MTTSPPTAGMYSRESFRAGLTVCRVVSAVVLLVCASASHAQDVRWSWFDVAYVQQDIGRDGSQTNPVLGQTVDVSASDGNGIKFRGSLGTWHNFFAFVDFNSSDIAVSAVVTNSQGQFPAEDEFDYTAIRGGIGWKWSMNFTTDFYGALSLDSTDLDFGSFAGENFDGGEKGYGGTIGVRSLFRDKLELRAHARYSSVGDVDLTTGAVDADTLFGVGVGYELIRGLSLTADFESGQFSSWNIGFRLDLDED